MALQEVIVTSHHTIPITDMHHGIAYTFKPGETSQIPLAAAVHFFGLGMTDRSHAWKRYGKTNDKDGMAYLNKFDLEVVELVAEHADVTELKGSISSLEDENAKLKERIAELESKKSSKKG